MGTGTEFTCKEPGCGLAVVYDRRTNSGGLGALQRTGTPPAVPVSTAAYLACANGHVHRYDVPAAQRGG